MTTEYEAKLTIAVIDFINEATTQLKNGTIFKTKIDPIFNIKKGPDDKYVDVVKEVTETDKPISIAVCLTTLVGETYYTTSNKPAKITKFMIDKVIDYLRSKGAIVLADIQEVVSIEELLFEVGDFPPGLYSKILKAMHCKFSKSAEWLTKFGVLGENELCTESSQLVLRKRYIEKINLQRKKLYRSFNDEKALALEIKKYRKNIKSWQDNLIKENFPSDAQVIE